MQTLTRSQVEEIWGIVYGLNLRESPATIATIAQLCPSLGAIAIMARLNALWQSHRVIVGFCDGRCHFWATNTRPVDSAARRRSLFDEMKAHHLQSLQSRSLENSNIHTDP